MTTTETQGVRHFKLQSSPGQRIPYKRPSFRRRLKFEVPDPGPREADSSPALSRRPGKAVLRRRSGFSLLEVILALAILAGAVAVLGEVARQGLETARIARDLTYAQFICDSLMAEIVSGLVYVESVDQVPVDEISDPSQMGWVYSIDVESTEIEGLVSVRVTVSQPLPEEKHPVRCSLVRWMQDPNVTFSSGTE